MLPVKKNAQTHCDVSTTKNGPLLRQDNAQKESLSFRHNFGVAIKMYVKEEQMLAKN